MASGTTSCGAQKLVPVERREQVTFVEIELGQLATGGTRRCRRKAAAFTGGHESDKSRGFTGSWQDRFWLLTSVAEVSFERQEYWRARRWLREAEKAIRTTGDVQNSFTGSKCGHFEQPLLGWLDLFPPIFFIVRRSLVPTVALNASLQLRVHLVTDKVSHPPRRVCAILTPVEDFLFLFNHLAVAAQMQNCVAW
jgi:hypothetical protein